MHVAPSRHSLMQCSASPVAHTLGRSLLGMPLFLLQQRQVKICTVAHESQADLLPAFYSRRPPDWFKIYPPSDSLSQALKETPVVGLTGIDIS